MVLCMDSSKYTYIVQPSLEYGFINGLLHAQPDPEYGIVHGLDQSTDSLIHNIVLYMNLSKYTKYSLV